MYGILRYRNSRKMEVFLFVVDSRKLQAIYRYLLMASRRFYDPLAPLSFTLPTILFIVQQSAFSEQDSRSILYLSSVLSIHPVKSAVVLVLSERKKLSPLEAGIRNIFGSITETSKKILATVTIDFKLTSILGRDRGVFSSPYAETAFPPTGIVRIGTAKDAST